MEPEPRPAVRFRHDRTREVILGGLDPPRRRTLQLSMARRLAAVPEFFAAAAEQYLPVAETVDDRVERRRVVGLLRRAADEATVVGDYGLVNRLLVAALELIDRREIAMLGDILTARHAALYGLGRFDEADEEYRTIEAVLPTGLERGPATVVQVLSLTHRSRLAEAIEFGLQALREFGITSRPRTGSPSSSTASSTISTAGWTTPTRRTIWLGPTSPSPNCSSPAVSSTPSCRRPTSSATTPPTPG
jgi:hypothetical protein